jgi:hypothetical protein
VGKVVSFPRKLEWRSIDAWEGTVRGTQLLARVVQRGECFHWAALNRGIPVGQGMKPSLEEAKDAAKNALEKLKVLHFEGGSLISS